mmetsp:Transcript_18596/g.53614  ORF Transcript_18596/g.53614 Transcript_18596/m.53614 type:complete len:204 (+) Transcript_18596:655-1266(+)
MSAWMPPTSKAACPAQSPPSPPASTRRPWASDSRSACIPGGARGVAASPAPPSSLLSSSVSSTLCSSRHRAIPAAASLRFPRALSSATPTARRRRRTSPTRPARTAALSDSSDAALTISQLRSRRRFNSAAVASPPPAPPPGRYAAARDRTSAAALRPDSATNFLPQELRVNTPPRVESGADARHSIPRRSQCAVPPGRPPRS